MFQIKITNYNAANTYPCPNLEIIALGIMYLQDCDVSRLQLFGFFLFQNIVLYGFQLILSGLILRDFKRLPIEESES